MAGRGYETVQELEADVAFVAYCMLRYGDWIAPIFERLERELAAMRKRHTVRDRARAALERYTLPPPLILPGITTED